MRTVGLVHVACGRRAAVLRRLLFVGVRARRARARVGIGARPGGGAEQRVTIRAAATARQLKRRDRRLFPVGDEALELARGCAPRSGRDSDGNKSTRTAAAAKSSSQKQQQEEQQFERKKNKGDT